MKNNDTWDMAWEKSETSEYLNFTEDTLLNYIDRKKIDFMNDYLPDCGTVVEVGAGSARLLTIVGLHKPYQLIALDNNSSALKLASKNLEQMKLKGTALFGDAENLPFEDCSIDVVLSGGLLEHFIDPLPVLKEMNRVLKPDGIFYADIVPRKFSLYRISDLPRILTSNTMVGGAIETNYSIVKWKQLLENAGFNILNIKSCGVYPPFKSLFFARLLSFLDGTVAARLLGWYFMVLCTKYKNLPF